MNEDEVLLRIEGLKTYFHTYEGVVKALEGIDIGVRKGETLGLVGETGCGKSVTALSVMRLIPSPPGKIESGRILFGEPSRVTALRKEYDANLGMVGSQRRKLAADLEKKLSSLPESAPKSERQDLRERLAAANSSYDLLTKSKHEMNEIRGNRISMIFQEPMTALNPAYTVGDQIGETIELHQGEMLLDDVLAQLEREQKSYGSGVRATRVVPKRQDTSLEPAESRGSLVCSKCGVVARDDWGACIGCGARFKGIVPYALKGLFLRIARSYYEAMRKNQYNSWAYMVNLTFATRRLQRRLKLAKLMRAEDALLEVKIAGPGRIAKSYPFELSGGMRQRAMIAMMMACKPDLLIADEPTTALDVTVEAQILALMGELQKNKGTSVLLITHDLGIIAEISHRVGIMYAGYVVELSSTREVFARPLHPYTNALLKSIPKIGQAYLKDRKKPLNVIPGVVPNLLKPPSGCRFHPRCDRALEVCKTVVPELRELEPGHFAACHNPVPFPEEVRGT